MLQRAAQRGISLKQSTGNAEADSFGLTGNAADYKLFALGTDGRYHEVSDWHFDDAPARLSAKKVYTICLTAQDGGSFDLSPDAKEVTLSIVLAR